MGSSKKHKRDSKKHKRRSRSRSRSPRYERPEREHRRRSDSYSEDNDGYVEASRTRHKKHKRDHSEHRHNQSRQYERDHRTVRDQPEPNTVDDDSDSSDCVEVPLDDASAAPPPPPPSISRKSPEAVPSPPPPPQVQKRRRSPTPPPAPKTSSRKRSVSPIPSNGAGDVLSVEETNKLRAKLGLKPLEVGPSKAQPEPSSRRRQRSPSPPPAPKASTSSSVSRKRSVSPIPDNGAGDVLSVDDTNKLRAKLGLRPLETSSKKRTRSPSPPPAPKTSSSSASKRSSSPIPENGAGDALSIEETNKLRAKLGLRPLEVGTTGSKSGEGSKGGEQESNEKLKDDWGEFYHKPAKNLSEKTQEEKIREKLKERREKRAIEEKLKRLKTLGEEEDVDDLKGWVAKMRDKDRLKKEAEERARLLDQLDEELVSGAPDLDSSRARGAESSRRGAFGKGSYRDRDLEGLRVEHDVEAFTEGRQVILTLKDANVLDEEAGDTLVNVNMIDDERYKRNVENRKANPQHYGYDVYCQDDVDEFGMPKQREVLGKYNEEIEGQRKSSFVIGSNAEQEAQEKRRLLEIKTKLEKKKLDSLETTPLTLVSDYFTETELSSFKKPKKKVRKIRQKLRADDLLASLPAEESMADLGSRSRRHERSGSDRSSATEDRRSIRARAAEILVTDDTPAFSEDLSTVKLDDAMEDDEDLQAALQKARRLKQKEAIISKALPIDPERIKSEVKEEPDSGGELDHHGAMLLNSTAEFCRTLGDIPTYGTAGNREEDPNEMMDFERDSASDHEGMESDPEEGPSSRRHNHGHGPQHSGTWNSVNTEQEQEDNRELKVEEVAILDEEPDVALSVAGALKLAQSKGYLEREESNRPSNARFAHLQAQNYSIEDKNYGEENDKYSRRDRYAGPITEFKEKETFKPNVKLEYIDDNGHLLTPKEAFRYLSHKFHGKGPGKNKVEKRLKKSEQEGLMKKMSSTDTPLGTLNMLQAKQKETQSPFIVLSGTKQNTSIIKQKR
ncbi:U4/U6.U5 tri-snRNP-associated protein 1 [Anopheles maculipalpis]|uniref:U4/U6.U5 tri-snRNP-associated protein 1 n=1 Tax=Anopheles maculipalpis TaxID=1496333 RepID=UPI002158E619|nr:U4/U6.U5 tri-snRNP-associated protein 1 [Anopheles maculipalpis]